MKTTSVSVIVPVYNGERTLRACLDSLLKQTFRDYEIIVVDNNSTDKTREIVEAFQKVSDRLIYVFEPRRSRGAARNRGLGMAGGDIIAMTDADCVVPADWLIALTRPIREHGEVVVQGNESDCVGNYWTTMQQEFNQSFLSACRDGKYIAHLDTKNCAVRRGVLLEVGLFNSSIGNLEDFELKVRLKQAGYRIYFLDGCRVDHFHKDSFLRLFVRRVDQGCWAARVYWLHKRVFTAHPEAMIQSMHITAFLGFFVWILPYLMRNGVRKFWFELITGIAWRIGILSAFVTCLISREHTHEKNDLGRFAVSNTSAE